MFPEITIHRPHGVVPKVAVRKRTVVEYQPSWLLLAVPTVAVLAARRKKSRAQTRPAQTRPAQPASGTDLPDAAPAAPRRGRRQVALVRLARLRRRPGSPTTVEVADVAVPLQNDATT